MMRKDMYEPETRYDATHFILLLIAVVSLLLTHVVFSTLFFEPTTSSTKTISRVWLTPDVLGDDTLRLSQPELTSELEIERRFVELARREALARSENERLKTEIQTLKNNLDEAMYDIKEAQKLFLHDLYPARHTIAALKSVFDTSNAMRAALWVRDGVVQTTELEVNAANERLQVCEEQLTFVKTAATAAALLQIGDAAEREKFFARDPTTIELIDMLAVAPERCWQRIASRESDNGFAVQAYRDCRDYSDSLLWDLSQHEAAEEFHTPINGPWTQDAWELILARMNDSRFEDYDKLFDHVVFLKDDPARSMVGAPPSAGYGYDDDYFYAYYDLYAEHDDAFKHGASDPARRHSISDDYNDDDDGEADEAWASLIAMRKDMYGDDGDDTPALAR